MQPTRHLIISGFFCFAVSVIVIASPPWHPTQIRFLHDHSSCSLHRLTPQVSVHNAHRGKKDFGVMDSLLLKLVLEFQTPAAGFELLQLLIVVYHGEVEMFSQTKKTHCSRNCSLYIRVCYCCSKEKPCSSVYWSICLIIGFGQFMVLLINYKHTEELMSCKMD